MIWPDEEEKHLTQKEIGQFSEVLGDNTMINYNMIISWMDKSGITDISNEEDLNSDSTEEFEEELLSELIKKMQMRDLFVEQRLKR